MDQEKLRPFGQWFRIETSRKQAIRRSRTLGGNENKFSRNREVAFGKKEFEERASFMDR